MILLPTEVQSAPSLMVHQPLLFKKDPEAVNVRKPSHDSSALEIFEDPQKLIKITSFFK